VIEYSPVFDKYDQTVDRESAYEILTKRMEGGAAEASADGNSGGGWGDVIFGGNPSSGTAKGKGRQPAGMGEMIGKELKRTIARKVATTIKDIIVGSMKGGKR
jgi:hypothetical protein